LGDIITENINPKSIQISHFCKILYCELFGTRSIWAFLITLTKIITLTEITWSRHSRIFWTKFSFFVPINFLSSFEKNHRKLSLAFISECTRKCLKGWEMDPLSCFIQLILTACNYTTNLRLNMELLVLKNFISIDTKTDILVTVSIFSSKSSCQCNFSIFWNIGTSIGKHW
jgi:hypothetical protein